MITADDMPQSLWITLKDPEQYEGITSAVVGLDGVSGIRDVRDILKPIYGTIDALKWGALGTAAFLVVAALLLVANTIRLAAFAAGARSASCGWSAPRRSTSRCRSCSRRW